MTTPAQGGVMCEHCLGLGVNLDAMPNDWALKQPQPKLADAVRMFGKCPHCCAGRTEFTTQAMRQGADTRKEADRRPNNPEQLGLFA